VIGDVISLGEQAIMVGSRWCVGDMVVMWSKASGARVMVSASELRATVFT